MSATHNFRLIIKGNFHSNDPVARALSESALEHAIKALAGKGITAVSTLEHSGVINLKVTEDEAMALRDVKGSFDVHGYTVAWKVDEVREGFPVDAPMRPTQGIRSVPWPTTKPIPLTADAEAKAALAARQQQVAARIARLQAYQNDLNELAGEITGETRKMLDGSTMIPKALADKCKTMARKPATR